MNNLKKYLLTCCTLILLSNPVMVLAADGKALVGGRLIDGYGHRPLSNSVILVKHGLIEAVGTVDTLKIPAGYQVISTEGMDVLPGLWESHAHLMINGHADYVHWDKAYIDRFEDEIMPASAVQLLLAGITSARDLGAPLKDSISIKNKIQSGKIQDRDFMSPDLLFNIKPIPGQRLFDGECRVLAMQKRKSES